MPRSGRRYSKPLQQSNGGGGSGSLPGCDRVRIPRARILLLGLLGVLVLVVVLSVYLSNDTSGGNVSRLPAVDLVKDRVRFSAVPVLNPNERTLCFLHGLFLQVKPGKHFVSVNLQL